MKDKKTDLKKCIEILKILIPKLGESMKKVFIPFCFVAMTAFACDATQMTLSDVPSSVQIFLKEYFSEFEVEFVRGENSEFEVFLKNGTKIFFDKRGRWKAIKSSAALPFELLPHMAREVIKSHYQNMEVVEINRDRNGFEIVLQNHSEFHLYRDGSFLCG